MLPGYAGTPVSRLPYSPMTTGWRCNKPQPAQAQRSTIDRRTLTVAITNPSKRRYLRFATSTLAVHSKVSRHLHPCSTQVYVAVDEIDEIDVTTYWRDLAIPNNSVHPSS